MFGKFLLQPLETKNTLWQKVAYKAKAFPMKELRNRQQQAISNVLYMYMEEVNLHMYCAGSLILVNSFLNINLHKLKFDYN